MCKVIVFTTWILVTSQLSAQNIGIGTASPTDQLHTTGTVRFEGYRGNTIRPVQLDSSGRMIVTGAVFSTSPAGVITDAGCSAGNGFTSTISVAGQPTSLSSSKIAVRINVTHTYDADLRIFLLSPTGDILTLANNNGFNGDNFTNTVFTDNASQALPTTATAAPFTGNYKPIGSLGTICLITPTVSSFGAMNGGTINPNGNWTLKVYDASVADIGTLDNWSITFAAPESFAAADNGGKVPYYGPNGDLLPSNITALPNGYIGIGTITPGAALEVDAPIRIRDGSASAGNVLTATNSTGDGTWAPPVQAGTGFLASVSTAFPVPTGTNALVPFTTTGINNNLSTHALSNAAFNNGTSRFTAPATGFYHFDVSVELPTGTVAFTPFYAISVFSSISGVLQGNTLTPATGAPIPKVITLSFSLRLVAGEYIYIALGQNTGSTFTCPSSTNTYFSGYRLY